MNGNSREHVKGKVSHIAIITIVTISIALIIIALSKCNHSSVKMQKILATKLVRADLVLPPPFCFKTIFITYPTMLAIAIS